MSMELRRRMMAIMAGGLPSYLKHITFTPVTDEHSHSFNIGSGAHNAVLISDCPKLAANTPSIMNGVFNFEEGAFSASGSRIMFVTSSGSTNYYASNSSGQTWTYTGGVLTISTSGTQWKFGAGIRYDLFYW